MSEIIEVDFSAVPNTNQISSYVHCGLCLEERPADIAPKDWAQLDVGYTRWGIQVWCKRHDCNVVHIDFEGQTHPANQTRKPESGG